MYFLIFYIDNEKITWLSSNIDPWTDVLQYWKETYAVRRTLYLLNKDLSVQDYFDKFKCLSTQEGKDLVRKIASYILIVIKIYIDL